jgi:DNA-binding NarL/FixJ family response regulator
MKSLLPEGVIKIAIADDHKILKEGIKTVLSFYKDIQVIADADNGKQLLNILLQTEPDVILLDLQMPVMDGITTLPEIRKKYPNIKVIILSMHNDVLIISKLLKSGAHSYLLKDSDPFTIYSTIKSCYLSDLPMS